MDEKMSLKTLWDIWYPPDETISCSTHYSIDEACRKLTLAINSSDEISGTAQDSVFIRYTTWRWARKHTVAFRGNWHKTSAGAVLEGKFTFQLFLKIWITLALLMSAGIEVTGVVSLLHQLAAEVPEKERLSLALFFIIIPPCFIALATGVIVHITHRERRYYRFIRRFIQRALQ